MGDLGRTDDIRNSRRTGNTDDLPVLGARPFPRINNLFHIAHGTIRRSRNHRAPVQIVHAQINPRGTEQRRSRVVAVDRIDSRSRARSLNLRFANLDTRRFRPGVCLCHDSKTLIADGIDAVCRRQASRRKIRLLDKHPHRTALRTRADARRERSRTAGGKRDIGSVDDFHEGILFDTDRIDAHRNLPGIGCLDRQVGGIDRDVAPVHGDIIRFFLLAFLSSVSTGKVIGKDTVGAHRWTPRSFRRFCLDFDIGALIDRHAAGRRANARRTVHCARSRHVDVGAADGHIATRIAVAFRRNHIGLSRRIKGAIAGNGKVAVLDSNGALPGVGRDGVGARHADGEVTLGADGAAVVAVELHVVSAIPGPGSCLVAGSGARVVLRAAHADPLGGERHARQQQLADHERASPRTGELGAHATPRSVRERARAAVVDWVVMDLLSHVSLLVVRGTSAVLCCGSLR